VGFDVVERVNQFNHNHSYPDSPHNVQHKRDMGDRVVCSVIQVQWLLDYKFHQVKYPRVDYMINSTLPD